MTEGEKKGGLDSYKQEWSNPSQETNNQEKGVNEKDSSDLKEVLSQSSTHDGKDGNRKKCKIESYYIAIAIFLGCGLLGVLIYFTVQNTIDQPAPATVILDNSESQGQQGDNLPPTSSENPIRSGGPELRQNGRGVQDICETSQPQCPSDTTCHPINETSYECRDACAREVTPCNQNGICLPLNASHFDCQCFKPFIGQTCDDVQDDTPKISLISAFGNPNELMWSRSSCMLNCSVEDGKCRMASIDQYQCVCYTEVQQGNCKVARPCLRVDNPCSNHGICNDQNNTSYECDCFDDYRGKNCSEKRPDLSNKIALLRNMMRMPVTNTPEPTQKPTPASVTKTTSQEKTTPGAKTSGSTPGLANKDALLRNIKRNQPATLASITLTSSTTVPSIVGENL